MPAVNAQMKQFFKKEWINVTMYAVITLLLFCSMFWEPLVYVTFIAMVLFCAFRPVHQTFYIIFFTYPFQSVYTVFIKIKFFNVYFVLFTILIFIIGVKYLIEIIQRKKIFNIYLFILSMAFLLYCFLPIGPYRISIHMQTMAIIAGLYLCYEYRNNISFKNLVYIANIGLFISCIFSFVAFETPRMLNILTQYTNYGYIKFQGMFGNPNGLAVCATIYLPCLVILFLKEQKKEYKLNYLILFLANFAFAYMTLARGYIMSLAIMFPLYAIFELIYYKKKGLLHIACVAVSVLVLCAVMSTSTKIYLVRFNVLPESSIVQYNESTDAAVVFPGTPAEPNVPENPTDDEIFVDDPGREGLWQRYWLDYTSSWQTILLGKGLSYPLIGNMDAHQSYIQILWQYGIVGVSLLLSLVIYYLKNLFNKKNAATWLILLPFLVSALVSTIVFNIWTFLLFVFIILSNDEVAYDT